MEKKTYTIKDFETKHISTPTITASGRLTHNGFDVNVSSILTKLIQEAGRWCRSYASDLFVDWRHIEDLLKSGVMDSNVYLFGFYESGVDSNKTIFNKYENQNVYGHARSEYRAIWRLDITVTDDHDIEMSLYEVNR